MPYIFHGMSKDTPLVLVVLLIVGYSILTVAEILDLVFCHWLERCPWLELWWTKL
jgi:hypothetical protein